MQEKHLDSFVESCKHIQDLCEFVRGASLGSEKQMAPLRAVSVEINGSNFERAIVASRDIEASETILCIPPFLCLTPDDVCPQVSVENNQIIKRGVF